MPTVLIPAPYRGPTRGLDRIATRGESIAGCLAEVEALHPGIAELVLDPATGGLHRFVKLFLNRELVGRDAAALARPVAPDDEIEILAAIGGG